MRHLTPEDIQEMERVYLDAMANGYAQDAQKTTIAELPGSKVIRFVSGGYEVVDFYFTNPYSDISTGQIGIFCGGMPMWTMQYGGRYAKIAIPFLKKCLRRTYVDERRFNGGRGPFFVRDERFTYVNRVRRASFADFEGEEHIFDLSEQTLGHHWYRGMLLVR